MLSLTSQSDGMGRMVPAGGGRLPSLHARNNAGTVTLRWQEAGRQPSEHGAPPPRRARRATAASPWDLRLRAAFRVDREARRADTARGVANDDSRISCD